MVTNDMSFLIGGDAGQGVDSSGAGFAKALARGGLHIFGVHDYHSRIRGGHNFYQIRVNERSVLSHTEAVHLAHPVVDVSTPCTVDGDAIAKDLLLRRYRGRSEGGRGGGGNRGWICGKGASRRCRVCVLRRTLPAA